MLSAVIPSDGEGLYMRLPLQRAFRLAGNMARLLGTLMRRHFRKPMISDSTAGSDIGIQDGWFYLFLRQGMSMRTPRAQLLLLQRLPRQCEVLGMNLQLRYWVPLWRTHEMPSRRHEVIPAPLASIQ